MTTIADTSAMSLAYRRRVPAAVQPSQREVQEEIARLGAGRALVIIGAVRQELLSGVREPVQFKRLREILAAFPDEPPIPQDYELAAEFYNSCRAKGIQGSLTDLLICAVARRKAFDILTLDQDFLRYASVIPIKLHPLSRK